MRLNPSYLTSTCFVMKYYYKLNWQTPQLQLRYKNKPVISSSCTRLHVKATKLNFLLFISETPLNNKTIMFNLKINLVATSYEHIAMHQR